MVKHVTSDMYCTGCSIYCNYCSVPGTCAPNQCLLWDGATFDSTSRRCEGSNSCLYGCVNYLKCEYVITASFNYCCYILFSCVEYIHYFDLRLLFALVL
jgi:hypothetical protein